MVAKRSLFDSGGTPLHFTEEGEGRALVLLHGFAASTLLNWRLPGITRRLRRAFRVIGLDLRGHGRSGKPRGEGAYGLEMVRDVVRLLDRLGIEKAHLVGYSLGGLVALKFSALFPERVAGTASIGAGWEDPENSAFLAALPGIEEALRQGRGIEPLCRHLGDDRPRPGRLHTWTVKLLTRYLNDGQALLGVVRGLREVVLAEGELERLRAPLLLVVGSRDPMCPGAVALARRIPHASLEVVEGADHLALLWQRGWLDRLERFLRDLC